MRQSIIQHALELSRQIDSVGEFSNTASVGDVLYDVTTLITKQSELQIVAVELARRLQRACETLMAYQELFYKEGYKINADYLNDLVEELEAPMDSNGSR